MGGSSSQPRTDPPLSPINAFSLGDLYTPQLSDSFQENTSYWQEPNPDDCPIEQVATSPTKKKKATRNRQKRVTQTEPAPRQTAWTTEEEIALAKGWRSVSENSERGNARKKDGFWVEVLEYVESKTKQQGRQTYDMVVGKWKVVRPAVEIRRTEGRDKAKAAAKNKGSKASGSSTMNDDALARLMVTEMTAAEVAQREKFMELKMREVECREREIAATEYRAQQEDIKLYLQPYDHLTGDQSKESFGDTINIGVDVTHPMPVTSVIFPASTIVMRLAQHREAMWGIQEHLLEVPIQEELRALRDRVEVVKAKRATLRATVR
ncbi:hypothetical protein Tco_1304704 [Tanacetum coccineum]